MIVPHQSPSACQAELTVHHRALRSRVISETCWCLWRFVRPGHYDGACRHRPIAPELFPFQATCALKRKVFPRFWLRDDIARKAAQIIGQVGTGTPLVLVCLALLSSSAGRALIKKEKKKKPPGMGRHAAKPSQKNTRPRVAPLFPAGDCGAMRRGGGVFSSPAWPGRCKGEEGGGGRRLLSLPAPKKKRRPQRIKKCIILTSQQHAPRRDNPAPPRPPSRRHLRLS
jgi:hypothetical protein